MHAFMYARMHSSMHACMLSCTRADELRGWSTPTAWYHCLHGSHQPHLV